MNNAKLTESMQDYLEAIFVILSDKPVCRVTDIKNHLNVSKPSVVQALNTLKSKGMILKEKYGYVTLTEEGMRKGEEILGKHNAIYKFLVAFFDMKKKEAQKLACELEHHFDCKTIAKIRRMNANVGSDESTLKRIKA